MSDARSLPLLDLNYSTASERMGILTYSRTHRRRGLFASGVVFLAKMLAALAKPRFRPPREPIEVCVAYETPNQHAALVPLLAHLSRHHVIHLRGEEENPFPVLGAYLASLPFLPQVLAARRSSSGYARESFAYVLHEYWLTYGTYVHARRLLARLRPRVALVANDHNMRTRTFIRAARDEGIRTAYIQHASVTDRFPPLDYDLALLDGEDSARKYLLAGPPKGRIALIGSPKADEAIRDTGFPDLHRGAIGICVNTLDAPRRVMECVNALVAALPDRELVFRPHPRDRRPWRSTLPSRVALSDPATESSYAFLLRVGVVVAGSSSIHLEGALLGRLPVRVPLQDEPTDHYGFVERGLAIDAGDSETLVHVLRDPPRSAAATRAAARPYNAALGTRWHARSAELGAALLAQLARDGSAPAGPARRLGLAETRLDGVPVLAPDPST